MWVVSSRQLSSNCCCLVKSPGILGLSASGCVSILTPVWFPEILRSRSCYAGPPQERAAVLREEPPIDVTFELAVRECPGKGTAVTFLSKFQGEEAGKLQNGPASSPAHCRTFVLLPKAKGNPEHPGTEGCLSCHMPDLGREYKTFPLSSTLGSR